MQGTKVYPPPAIFVKQICYVQKPHGSMYQVMCWSFHNIQKKKTSILLMHKHCSEVTSSFPFTVVSLQAF